MLKAETTSPPEEIDGKTLDVDLSDSVALKRLINEVRNEAGPAPGHSSAYNRTYHRHNR